jgi:hypothetical protein
VLATYVTGIVAIVGVLVVWTEIQAAWRRVFLDASADPDVLAGRMGCHGCANTDDCARRLDPSGDAAEERIT